MGKYMILSLLAYSIIFFGCSSGNDSGNGLLDSNGLSKDINELVPDSILKVLDSLGMPINTGDSPPNLEGFYLAKPFILVSSNISFDFPGKVFADYYVRFYEQNNSKLTVSVDYLNGLENGVGVGSFIVGDNNKFSVFSRVTTTVGADSAFVLNLYSGILGQNGIDSLYVAIFMLDNLGNPSNYFINDGDGRVIYDSDGFSETVTGFPKKATTNVSNKLSIAQNK